MLSHSMMLDTSVIDVIFGGDSYGIHISISFMMQDAKDQTTFIHVTSIIHVHKIVSRSKHHNQVFFSEVFI